MANRRQAGEPGRDARERIADTLRGRILRGLHAGALKQGERLPSARDLRREFEVDHRIVVDAYRMLVNEGLVEQRARGGVYVAAEFGSGMIPLPSASWLTDIFTQAVIREIPLVEVHDWMRRAVGTLRLRAVAVQGTGDQLAGLCRELRDDYGLDCAGIDATLLASGDPPPEARYADVFVTTEGFGDVTRALAARFGKPVIVAEVRPDLIGGEWRLLLRKRVYVVVKDPRFADILRQFFAGVPGEHHIHTLVLGRDSIDDIPHDAYVYVTRSARDALGTRAVRGRLMPSARLFSDRTAREIVDFITRANLRAMAATGQPPSHS